MRSNAPKKAKLSEGRLRSNAEGACKGPRALPHAARFNSIVKDQNPEGLGAVRGLICLPRNACPLTNSEQNWGAVNQNVGLLGVWYCAFALCLQGSRCNYKLFLICYKMPVVISLCRGAFCLSGHSTQRLGRLFLSA